MKKFMSEFKEFISRGSVVDMAVGIMIGAAFKAIVDSLVNDVISPLIGLVADTNFTDLVWHIGGVTIGYGAFITAILNFFLMALALFFLIKGANSLRTLGSRIDKRIQPEEPPAPTAPTTKTCPYCKSEIAIGATRCPHCTSILE